MQFINIAGDFPLQFNQKNNKYYNKLREMCTKDTILMFDLIINIIIYITLTLNIFITLIRFIIHNNKY